MSSTPIRYMGTKRHMADRVKRVIAELDPPGSVLDLFSGMGCVAEALAEVAPVVTNDALVFTTVLARARFTGAARSLTVAEVIDQLKEPYRANITRLAAVYKTRLREEQRAIDSDADALKVYMTEAICVANDETASDRAAAAEAATGSDRYCLTTLYFSAGYFGLRQSIEIDSLRYAIDQLGEHHHDRDWLIGAWLAAAATVTNAPGHTAQFLKPNSKTAANRIRRYWKRSIWEEFQNKLISIKLVGDAKWRKGNRVESADAIELLRDTTKMAGIKAIYADPPYTRDQYSRYYHVYETLYRYDFPDSAGKGRARSDRFTTGFSQATGVVDSFKALFVAVAALNVPLVLSYPSAGLLSEKGEDVMSIARESFSVCTTESFPAEHSTLGASSGTPTKTATEHLYVCRR